MLKPGLRVKVIREGGQIDSSFTDYCVKCGEPNVTRTTGGQNFDENGWYTSVTMTCQSAKCKHTWVEKLCQTPPSTKLW